NAKVQYQQEKMSGVFIFSTQTLLDTIDFKVNLIFKNWLLNYNAEHPEPSKVPDSILKFLVGDLDDTVRQLINLKIGYVYCLECDKNVPYKSLKEVNYPLHGGYNYDYLECPGNHPLLRTKALHITELRKL
ncbi:MAG: hypothetical protein HQL46_13010, partial [Gammaproteobacteria bacterium]|nr:hypothetical protein [Gammaproteobacteria bacterium]